MHLASIVVRAWGIQEEDPMEPCPQGSPHATDLALRDRVLAGDPDAIEELYRTYRERLVAFARRRAKKGSAYDAEDVAEETLLWALKRIQRYDARASLLTWLCAIAVKVADKQRRRDRLRSSEDLLLALPDQGADPTSELEREEVIVHVHSVLDLIPSHHREALRLHLEGLSGEEISVRLGLTKHAANSLLARARASFKMVSARIMPWPWDGDPRSARDVPARRRTGRCQELLKTPPPGSRRLTSISSCSS